MIQKYIYAIFLLTTFSNLNVNAQRTCSSHEHYQQMLQSNPAFAKERVQIEEYTIKSASQVLKQTRVLKTIPVVVHVVYNTAAQNISDAQINSQIAVLNADFRKLNVDFASTPAVFQSLGADCEIEFCLAKQTPAGVATNGILRIQTSTTSFIDDDQMKYTAQGGSDAWDRAKYLNIWVCPLGGGLLGYAQFPGGPAASDGVVVRPQSFGTIGTVTAPYNKGRTATHEVGHWLNLFHIWGDDGTSCAGTDLVNDTPNQADENYGCPTFPAISCSNTPNGDLFMNYMDYTDDNCMTLFTTGQCTRMNALFAVGGSRVSLLTSNGCVVPVPNTCGVANSLVASAVTATSATLNWSAVSTATSYTIQYKLATASTWITTTSTTNSKAITGLISASNYQFQIQAICPSGTGVYASAVAFSTTGNTGCVNNYEPNNTRAAAVSIPIGTTITSMLASNTDKDYFKVTTTNTAPKLSVSLANLPADYELKLYNAGGTLLMSSLKTGTLTETVKYNAVAVGQTYTIYVYGYNGAFNASQCYTLSTQASATNFRVDQPSDDNEKSAFIISPNPAQDKLDLAYFATEEEKTKFAIYTMLGQPILEKEIESQVGRNHVSLDLSHVKPGIYLIEMVEGNERHVQRVSIIR